MSVCRLVVKVLGDGRNLARSESHPPNGKTHGVNFGCGLHGQGLDSYLTPFCCKIGRPVGLPFYGWPSRLCWPKSVLLFEMAGSGMNYSLVLICYPFRESAPPALCPVMGIGSEGELTPDGGDSDEEGDEKTSRAIRSNRS
jgi:hypothetical protein